MKIKKIKSKEVRDEAIRLVQGFNPFMPVKVIKKLDIDYCFDWEDSPQCYDFWSNLHQGVTKNTKDLELPYNYDINHEGAKKLLDDIFAISDHQTDQDTDHETIRPDYYGGADNPYECQKVIAAWGLGFNLGNVMKYVSRAGKKDPEKAIEDLQKAINYLKFEIEEL